MTQRIDSLISKNAFFIFSRADENPFDSINRTRQYYIDKKTRCLVKCIIDTTFEDFFKTTYRQVIMYFYRGTEFNSLWINSQTSKIDYGESSGDFLKDYNEYKRLGRFRKKSTQDKLDRAMREYLYLEISNSIFMQGRNFGN